MKVALAVHVSVLLTIACIALLPVFSVMIAGAIADRNSCDLDEGSVHPCVVNERDIGQDLYALAMLGWLMIATIPLGIALMAIYLLIITLYYLIRAVRRRRRAPAGV